MPKLWTRPHVNGWRVYVEYVPALDEGDTPGRYVASALAPDGVTRGTSNHATLELAQAAADACVRETSGHQCSCSPWLNAVDSED